MKRPPYTLLFVLQACVVGFALMAIFHKSWVWYAACLVCVTVLLVVAVSLWKRLE